MPVNHGPGAGRGRPAKPVGLLAARRLLGIQGQLEAVCTGVSALSENNGGQADNPVHLPRRMGIGESIQPYPGQIIGSR
jgi:hypothetical protein